MHSKTFKLPYGNTTVNKQNGGLTQGAMRQFYDSNLMQLHQIKTQRPVYSIIMAFGTLAIASRSVITDVKTNSQALFLCLSKQRWQIDISDSSDKFFNYLTHNVANKIL